MDFVLKMMNFIAGAAGGAEAEERGGVFGDCFSQVVFSIFVSAVANCKQSATLVSHSSAQFQPLYGSRVGALNSYL